MEETEEEQPISIETVTEVEALPPTSDLSDIDVAADVVGEKDIGEDKDSKGAKKRGFGFKLPSFGIKTSTGARPDVKEVDVDVESEPSVDDKQMVVKEVDSDVDHAPVDVENRDFVQLESPRIAVEEQGTGNKSNFIMLIISHVNVMFMCISLKN